jgi:hypothetical protein
MENERRYTLEQAAAKIGFRTDDLGALLPDVGIDITTLSNEGGTVSEAEVERLAALAEQIKNLHGGLYIGGSEGEGLE